MEVAYKRLAVESFPKKVVVNKGTLGCHRHQKDLMITIVPSTVTTPEAVHIDVFMNEGLAFSLLLDLVSNLGESAISVLTEALRDRKIIELLKS